MLSVAQIGKTLTQLAFGGKAVGDLRQPAAHAPEVFGEGVPMTRASGHFSTGAASRMMQTYASGSRYAIDWVADAITLIAETVATADYQLYDPTSQERKPIPKRRYEAEKGARTAPQDLVNLLERPNPWMDRTEWIELMLVDWFLAGDHFSLLFRPDIQNGRPIATYRLAPQLVEVIPGDGELIGKYLYHAPGVSTPVEFSPEDILHIRRPNPHDPYRGASIIAGAPRLYEMEVALTETQAAYYERGAKLTGVLESERNINDGIISKIRRQFMGLYGGTDNAYQVAVLERGLKFNSVSNNAAEAQFGAMSQMSRDRILAMFRIPPQMLGLGDVAGGAAAGATEEERRTFANGTIRPLVGRLSRALTNGLVDRWGLEYAIEYEYQMPIEQQVNLGSTFAATPGVTVQEVREWFKLPPLSGKNEKYNDLVLNLPGDNENGSKVKDRPLAGEPGRPPNGENTASFDEKDAKDAQTGE